MERGWNDSEDVVKEKQHQPPDGNDVAKHQKKEEPELGPVFFVVIIMAEDGFLAEGPVEGDAAVATAAVRSGPGGAMVHFLKKVDFRNNKKRYSFWRKKFQFLYYIDARQWGS